MANSKKDKAIMLDPDRFRVAQQNAVMPGGPPNQQNNPQNVQSVGQQSASPDGISRHPYGDTGNKYAQMGADVLNPMMVPRSQLPQNAPVGEGYNRQPFGYQPQPSPSAEEPMEGMRLGQEAMQKGLNASQFMGITGSPALMPGALAPTIPGSGMPLNSMPTTQMVDGGQMVPGSTPQKIQKKGKK
jgi:hypothetical protein